MVRTLDEIVWWYRTNSSLSCTSEHLAIDNDEIPVDGGIRTNSSLSCTSEHLAIDNDEIPVMEV